ncbi:RNA polymerase sigma factor [Dactylosporangium darangshiense]|uniref:RNA polymerase sigma factor n=1 Tax=Dactylosporangium darangshiense TaxID=579108 RepID=UPI0036311854
MTIAHRETGSHTLARAPSSTARFEDLYRSCYQDLLGYALRRVDRPQDAADVVADTFLVAWRRIGEIPSIGLARGCSGWLAT